ncbi:MAG: MFS transporter, partial [candidate division Zixibacteria bacterium]|nr:MFS transporter [candidate division Zixibacteria bacterium]
LTHLKLFSPNAKFYLGGTFFMGYATSILWMLYNLYLKQLGFSEGVMGEIMFFQGLGTVIVAIPAAIAADYFRLKKVMILASLMNTTSFVLMTFITEIKILYIVAMFAGAGWTVHFVVASPFFMRNSSAKERTHLFSVNYALDWGAGLLGALIGGYIPRILLNWDVPLVTGYRISLLMGAIFAAMSVLFYLRIKTPAAIKIGKILWRKYLRARDWQTTFKLCLPQILIGLGAGLVIPYLNIYFADRFNLDSASIGTIFSVGQIFTVFGFLIGPILAKKLGLVRVVAFSQLASIPFFFILAFSFHLPPSILAFWFRGSLMNMAWPLYNNFAMEKVGPEYHAGTNSLLSLSWNISWMFSTFIGGKLIEHHGFVPVMMATICLYACVSTAILLFFKKEINIGTVENDTPQSKG